jgi:hypothetical protein
MTSHSIAPGIPSWLPSAPPAPRALPAEDVRAARRAARAAAHHLRVPLIGSLAGTELLLALLHAFFTWPEHIPASLSRLFDVDREGNLPSWFSASQLLLLALVMAAAAFAAKKHRFVWVFCAAAALFLSADEASALHELAGSAAGDLFENARAGSMLRKLASFPSYYWALIYVPIAAPLGVAVLWHLWRDLGENRNGVLVGAAVFVTGAVLLDYLEGHYGNDQHARIPIYLGGARYLFDIFLIEELLEMAGVTLAINAMLRHLGRTA